LAADQGLNPFNFVNNDRSSSGLALVELILIVPFVLILVGGAVEFSRLMRAYATLNSVSREIVGAAYRECINQTPAAMNGCLQQVFNLANSTSTADNMLPNFTMILTVYESATPPPPPAPQIFAAQLGQFTNNTSPDAPPSKINISNFDPALSPARRDLLLHQVRLLYGEIYYPYNSIIGRLADLFNYSNGVLYEATVF